MTLREYKQTIKQILEKTIKKSGFPKVEIQVKETTRPEFGQLYVNTPFTLGKILKRRPIDIAAELVGNIEVREGIVAIPFEPGYLNFRISQSQLALKTLRESMVPDLGKGETVIIEHTSVNPNKALHVGHGRNLVIGDSIARILKATGHITTIINYVDDSGVQVADILVGFLHAGYPVRPSKGTKFDQYVGDEVYVGVNERYAVTPSLEEKRKSILQKLEGDNEISRFAKEITVRILHDQLKTCWRLNARYDLLAFESEIISLRLWDNLFRKMKKARIAKYEDDGRLKGTWVVAQKHASIDPKNVDYEKVLVRSDGTATYIAKDIPFAAWKLGLTEDKFSYSKFSKQPDSSILWRTSVKNGEDHPKFGGADRAITVIDVRQNRLQEIIRSVLEAVSKKSLSDRYIHLGYEVVTLSRESRANMSGRKGVYVNVDEALNAIAHRAMIETRKRNPGASQKWVESIAEKIAIAALRYSLVRQDLDKVVVFDFAESLRLDGETGPYVQYSFARACRIIEKAGEAPVISESSASLLDKEWESSLILSLAKLGMRIEESALNLSPKNLAKYTFFLSSQFNAFYERSPVLQEQNRELRNARVALVHRFKETLGIVTNLLGIDTPEKI